MASPAQINANRANSLKSTGPRSAEGKSASRFNALKHGMDAASIVIPGEDPAEYEALAAHYLDEYHPQSASESFHVDAMLRADWQKRRLQAVEGDLYRSIIAESSNATLIAALLSDSPAAKLLARVQRQIAAFERTWYRANAELRRAREHYLDFLSARPAPGELASFRQSTENGRPDSPAAPSATPNWPPTDAKTGRPAFFVG
jgi:hypothetical protein